MTHSARAPRGAARGLARWFGALAAAVSMAVVSMAAVSLVPGRALAQDKRAAVMSFEGPRAAKLRTAVVQSLGGELTVVPSKEVEAKAGQLGADLKTAEGKVAVARELQIDVYVGGRVDKAGRNWVLVLSAASGDSGDASEVSELNAKDANKLAALARRKAASELASAIAQASRPEKEAAKPVVAPEPEAEPEPEPEPVAEQPEEAPQEEPRDEKLPMALALELGAGGFSRDYEYRENLSSLPVYDIAAPPIAYVSLQWFPAAHFSSDAIAHIGLRARGQLAFGLSSGLESGGDQEFDTSSSLIEVGVRGRLPLGALQLAADVSYGSHTYAIEPADGPTGPIASGIPSVSYGYLRFHLDASLALGDSASLGLGFGILPVLGLGEVEEWFPQAGGLAMEGDVTFAYALFSSLDVVASIGARRYAITIDPTVQDVNNNRPIAAGFVDQYVFGQLGLRLRLGGTP